MFKSQKERIQELEQELFELEVKSEAQIETLEERIKVKDIEIAAWKERGDRWSNSYDQKVKELSDQQKSLTDVLLDRVKLDGYKQGVKDATPKDAP